LPRSLAVATFVLLLPIAVGAQTAPAQGPRPADAPAAGQQPPRPPGQLANVRLDVTIVDQRGDAPALSKVVTMIVADRESGRIRSGRANTLLNIDAHPDSPRDGRIRVSLTLEYRPSATENDRNEPALITESVTVVLEDGKPLVVTQSADPTSDRKVRVELKATVMK